MKRIILILAICLLAANGWGADSYSGYTDAADTILNGANSTAKLEDYTYGTMFTADSTLALDSAICFLYGENLNNRIYRMAIYKRSDSSFVDSTYLLTDSIGPTAERMVIPFVNKAELADGTRYAIFCTININYASGILRRINTYEQTADSTIRFNTILQTDAWPAKLPSGIVVGDGWSYLAMGVAQGEVAEEPNTARLILGQVNLRKGKF